MTPSRELAAFAASAAADGVPSAAIGRLKLGMLQAIGCGVVGASTSSGVSSAQRTPEEATIWGTARRAPASSAVAENASAVHAWDHMALHDSTRGATGAWTVPVVLGVGERTGSSGRTALAAAAVGAELALRVLAAAEAAYARVGLHAASFGTLAAAAITARIAGASADTMAAALGSAACNVPTALTTAVHEHATVAETYAGHAASRGVAAADLAVVGIAGPTDWIEPWCHIFPGTDPAPLTAGLATEWFIERADATPWRPPNELLVVVPRLARQLAAEAALDHRGVHGAIVRAPHLDSYASYEAPSPAEAASSLPYLVADALVHPLEDDRARRTAGLLIDDAVVALHRRVQLWAHDEHAARGAPSVELTVRTLGGEDLHASCELAAEEPEDPTSRATRWFLETTIGSLGRARSAEVLDMVLRIEDVVDVASLGRALATSEATRS